MKKIKEKVLQLGVHQFLTPDQMRKITGGCTVDSDCGNNGLMVCDTLYHACVPAGHCKQPAEPCHSNPDCCSLSCVPVGGGASLCQ